MSGRMIKSDTTYERELLAALYKVLDIPDVTDEQRKDAWKVYIKAMGEYRDRIIEGGSPRPQRPDQIELEDVVYDDAPEEAPAVQSISPVTDPETVPETVTSSVSEPVTAAPPPKMKIVISGGKVTQMPV